MRIFHQRLPAAKVLISDNEADEIVFRAVPRGALDTEIRPVGSRRVEGLSSEPSTAIHSQCP